MKILDYNAIKVDYMRLSLMAVAYFILNFEDMVEEDGRYVYDLEVNVKDKPLVITAEYRISAPFKGEYPFSFYVESEDVDLELYFEGCYNLACSYASDIATEYIRRVKK